LIRIAVTQAAFEAIAATLPLGSVSYENAVNERGERYVWLPPNVVDRLKAQRRPARAIRTWSCESRRRSEAARIWASSAHP
jgi:hypothetical protein